LVTPPDLLLVVGGYNSSNTSHLAEMGEAKLPTYFIRNSSRMISTDEIEHYDQHAQKEKRTTNWLPKGRVKIGVTAGASCPNNVIEETIAKLFQFRGVDVKNLVPNLD
jgi:4-hydroxy-3-methylbut-2-enyl diphosphate reductase